MSDPGSSSSEDGGRAGLFLTTHWSLVLTVGQADPARAMEALDQLCQAYWYPLYAYLRRRGYAEADAQDLTQGFFTVLIKRRALEKVVPGRAKFRTFLLCALRNYLLDEHDRVHAQKRGGGQPVISLDAQQAEQRYRVEVPDTETPESLFERTWATTLIDQAVNRLEREFVAEGKEIQFAHLRGFIVDGVRTRHYAEVAQHLGMSEEAVKKAVQRLRDRFRATIREEIAKTVTTRTEVDEELRHLIAALSRDKPA